MNFKMLKHLVENKLQAKLLLIQDKEEVSCQDLFLAFLTKCECDNLIKKIHFICCENPPAFYLSRKNFESEKITFYNYFSDPCGWNNVSTAKTDLNSFTADPGNLSETAFFIDSLSLLSHYQGYCSLYKSLCILKRYCKKIVCIIHGDLFSSEQIEELSFLTTTFIKLQNVLVKKNVEEKVAEVIYKKPGGKIIKQEEIFFIGSDFVITSRSKEIKVSVSSNAKEDFENLTTFKLGLVTNKEERKAKDEFIMPYLKTKNQSKQGEILYQPEAAELEEDPDDDLDI